MQSKTFGQTGELVPVIGQGTWKFPTNKNEFDGAVKALRQGIELGMTHIDTAEMYKSEEVVGQAIKTLPREKLFIVSKVMPSNATFHGTIEACEQSLRNLGTDYLDCYLLHWRGSIPLADTIKGLEKLIDDGKIRSMGVSNFDVYDMEEALGIAKHPIACNQILYNIFTRGPERQLMPLCATKKIAIVAYTPFGEKRIPEKGTEGGDMLQEIADKHGTTVRQVILSFIVHDPNVFTIPKAAKEQHVTENAGAGNVILTAEDIRQIDHAFPAPKNPVSLEMN
ncbi:MAG: aldo/keto reductase [Candidatus Melainabacteria bacterium]|nr:aldo/keto reductase [Candidatus Melainabacteria bacterium]